MRTHLIILFAIICCAFSTVDAKAQSCPDFYVKNSTTSCRFEYMLVWDCGGGSTVTVNNVVSPGSVNFEPNPGVWPNCCRFAKIGFVDCAGNVVTLDPSVTSIKICDCTGAMVTIDLIWNGTYFEGAYIY